MHYILFPFLFDHFNSIWWYTMPTNHIKLTRRNRNRQSVRKKSFLMCTSRYFTMFTLTWYLFFLKRSFISQIVGCLLSFYGFYFYFVIAEMNLYNLCHVALITQNFYTNLYFIQPLWNGRNNFDTQTITHEICLSFLAFWKTCKKDLLWCLDVTKKYLAYTM